MCVCVCVCLCTPLSIEFFFLCMHVYQINCFFTSPNQLLFYFLCISLSFLSLFLSLKTYIYIYHHHVVPPARISLTHSRHFSLLFIASGRSSGLHRVSSHSCWSSCFCTAICGGPPEYIAYELVLASTAVSDVSGSSNLYSFRDGGVSV